MSSGSFRNNYRPGRNSGRGFQLTLFGPSGYVATQPSVVPLPAAVAGLAGVNPSEPAPKAISPTGGAGRDEACSTAVPDAIGKVAASRIVDIIARPTLGFRASRTTYMADLIKERMSGRLLPSPANIDRQWQSDHEIEAFAAYGALQEIAPAGAGYVLHPRLDMSGASVSGFAGSDGLILVVCPATAVHAETLLKRTVNERVRLHMLWAMACTGREWCDLVSFDPRMPAGFELVVLRYMRDEQRIRRLEGEVLNFLNELEALVETLGEVGAAERLAAKRAEFSVPVRRQAIERSGGYCEAVGGVYGLEPGVRCNSPLATGVEFDHYPIRAVDGGDGSLNNCVAACRTCHRYKTRTFDGPEIAKRKRIQEDAAGEFLSPRRFLSNRLGPLKRKMSGLTVPRGDGAG